MGVYNWGLSSILSYIYTSHPYHFELVVSYIVSSLTRSVLCWFPWWRMGSSRPWRQVSCQILVQSILTQNIVTNSFWILQETIWAPCSLRGIGWTLMAFHSLQKAHIQVLSLELVLYFDRGKSYFFTPKSIRFALVFSSVLEWYAMFCLARSFLYCLSSLYRVFHHF